MGAYDFYTAASGKTMEAAFDKAHSDAQWEHGHGGYSGTIAEKPGARLADSKTYATEQAALDRSRELMRDYDHWCNDKWGDAAALKIEGGKWLFFGLASS